MQNVNLQFPDSDDLNDLLRQIKAEILKEFQRKDSPKSNGVIYLTRFEIATKYRISLPTLHKHTKAGMPSVKIGKRRLYDASAVSDYFFGKNKK